MATIKDIAARAGVTHSVVSRVLNKDPSLRVGPLIRRSIEAIADELGYVPNFAARALRDARSHIIAIAMHDLTNPVYGEILAGAQRAADARGHAILIGDVDALAQGKTALGAMIQSRSIDGLVMQPVGSSEDDILWRAAVKSVPTVLLQSEPNPAYGVVRLADREAGHLATQHLIENDHRVIGIVSTAAGNAFTNERISGWRDAMTAAKLHVDDALIEPANSDPTSGRAALGALLKRRPDVTGVVVANVVAALGCLAAAEEVGRAVPDDLSLIAIHDVALAMHSRPALTTVKLPLEQLGHAAVQMILDRSSSTAGRVTIISEPAPQLVLRGSTMPRRRVFAIDR